MGIQQTRTKKYNQLKNQNNKEQGINFDINTLHLFCSLVFSKNTKIKRGNLLMLKSLMDVINVDTYANDIERMKYLRIIAIGIDGKINKGIVNPLILRDYVISNIGENNDFDFNILAELNNGEVEYINSSISNTLNYHFLFKKADQLIELGAKLKTNNSASIIATVKECEDLIKDIQNDFRKNRSNIIDDTLFSLQEQYLDEYIRGVHAYLSNPSSKLLSGVRGLNEMTAGGFERARIYCFFGLPGSGKSNVLLDLAKQIKNNNPYVQTKDPTKKPCIILLTQENSVRETVCRLFKMTTNNNKSINEYEVEDAITALKRDGGMTISDNNPIDIIVKYKPNGSIDTSYLYELLDELEDKGLECVCLIHDYLFRLRSVERYKELRLELGAVVNELKVLAILKDIPVICASQLNKEGKSMIENAINAGKLDTLKFLNETHIAESYSIMQNIDFGCIIRKDLNYQGFKCIKLRYAELLLELFYQPIQECGLGIVEDINCQTPLYRKTVTEQIESMAPPVMNSIFQQRKSIDEIMNEQQAASRNDSRDNLYDLTFKKSPAYDNNILNKYDITEGEFVSKSIPIRRIKS